MNKTIDAMLGVLVELLRPLSIRGKFRLLSPFVRAHGTVCVRVNGARMPLELGDLIQRNVYLGSYEVPQSQWVSSVLCDGDSALDVGANCGYYTTLFHSIVGQAGRVVAVEANPRLAQRLAEVISLNRLTNVELIAAGASDFAGETSLYIPPGELGNDDATMSRVEGWEEVTVPLVRLGEELPRRGVGKIRLMKIDVEGHELRVLRGMEAMLRIGAIEYLLIEMNDYWLGEQGSSAGELAEFCNSVGFTDVIHGTVPPRGGMADLFYRHTRVSTG